MKRWPIVAGLGSTQTLAYGSTYYLPAILAPSMAAGLGVAVSTIFLGLSLALVTAAVLGPRAGRWVDAGLGRQVLVAAHCCYALGLGLLAIAQGPWSMCAGWILIGLGMAMGQYETAFAVLTSYYGQAARGSITGITLIAGFASTICWPIHAALDATIGWRLTCAIWALSQLALAVPAILWALPLRPLHNHCAPQHQGTAAPPEPGSSWVLLVLAFLFAVTWFTTTAIGAHLPLLLMGLGLSTAQAVAMATLMGPMQVLARIIEAIFLRRYHPLIGARIASLLHPLGAGALFLVGPVLAPLFVMAHGAGNGILTIAKGTLPLALFGMVGYGRRQGVLMLPARMGMAIAPFAFGLAVAAWGHWALSITGGLTLIAGLGLFTLRARYADGAQVGNAQAAAPGHPG
ncbi:MAG: MFS transporter, partial [Planctomycetota bacterium]